MYMEDINIFLKMKKVQETLIQTVRIYSQNVGMEFGIEKFLILIMKREKKRNYGGNWTTKSG